MPASNAAEIVLGENAANLVRGDIYENVPGAGIVFDSQRTLVDEDYTFSTYENSPFSFVKSSEDIPQKVGLSISKNIVIFTGDAQDDFEEYENCFSLSWKDIGTDADGDRIDFSLVCAKLRIKYIDDPKHPDLSTPGWTTLIGASPAEGSLIAHPQYFWYVSMTFETHFTKTKNGELATGEFLMGIDDLDVPEYNSQTFDAEFSEQFELISGFGENVYIPDNNILNIKNNSTLFRPTAADTSFSYKTGLACAIKNGTRFRWSASSAAGTHLLKMFEPHKIVATKGGGGSITHLGERTVGWKNDAAYHIEAAPSHKISRVVVDGKDIPVSSEREMDYVFPMVKEDHTIHVEFQEVPVSIIWIDTLTGEKFSSYGLLRGQASPVPILPAHRGHRFSHLSGDDWSCVLADSTVYVNYSPYIYNVPHFSCARYNGFTFSYKALADEDNSLL